MGVGRDIAIFKDILNHSYTDTEKLNSIRRVIGMPTINSITKEEVRTALKWLMLRVPQYVSVEEALPPREGEYLIALDDGFVATTYYEGGEFDLWADAGEVVAWAFIPQYVPREINIKQNGTNNTLIINNSNLTIDMRR